MKKSVETVPVFGSRARQPQNLSLEVLKTTGETFVTYGIRQGEVIEFPDTAADVVAVEQSIRANDDGKGPKQRLIQVLRNGKYSWLSLGVLNRTDYNREPTCKFCAEMNELPNDLARIEHLYGKKITCASVVEKPFQKFDRQTGVRIDGQTEMRPTPIIEYVG